MTEPDTPIPSYRNPPIIEAVWSVQFKQMSWLLPPHTGLFWELIRKEFPTCEEQTPIAHIVEAKDIFTPQMSQAEVLPVPPLSRQWFVSSSSNELIQLQRDRFCCNWRSVRPSDVYPRYRHMRKLFESAWSTLTRFVVETGQSPPSVDQCEMTYINHIRLVGDVFPPLTWQADTRFLPAPATLGAKLAFDLPRLNGRLHVSLRHAIRTDKPTDRKELLVLELTARGLPQGTDTSGLLDWYALAREAIVRAFTDLTSAAMHEVWEREQ